MTIEVHIDPNVRVTGNQTRVGYEDVKGGPIPVVGQRVLVREPESDIIGLGEVTRLMPEQRLIYLAVDWKSLVPQHFLTSAEFLDEVRKVVDGVIADGSATTGASVWHAHYYYSDNASSHAQVLLTA